MDVQVVDAAHQIIYIRRVLSRSACQAQIAHAESHGFSPAPITTDRGPVMSTSVRNNTRVLLDDPARAARLLERLRPQLPARQEGWRLHGLNERLRWYRYGPGERFNWHLDGAYVRSRDKRSWLTLMVYLNDGFSGGETEFVVQGRHVVVRPEAGAVLLFKHRVRHLGAMVLQGRKYVLRTDVMYRCEQGVIAAG